jgi:AAHS family 4-hydroxybenzoate transporter-like MFS transporter
MLTMAAVAIASVLILSRMSIDARAAVTPIVLMLALSGAMINAVQTTMYALAAHVYPTSIRATGVGTAVAFGRIGGVVAPYAGSWALESGGASLLFGVIAATLTVVFGALASLRHHIPGAAAARAAASSAESRSAQALAERSP